MATPERVARPVSAQKRWPALLLGMLLGAGGAAVAVQWFDQTNDDADLAVEQTELASVEVKTTDLIEEVEWAGVLDYAGQTVVTGNGGTVTGVVEPGTQLERGAVVVEVDARPMVAFHGEVPFYRTMERDSEGPDVFELESNLVELGYDPDATVTVDQSFSYYTELMVERWQEDLGIEATGIVEAGDAIMLDGSVVTLDAPVIGSPATGTLLNLARRSELVVTVPVAAADSDDWHVGQSVMVVFADESEQEGSVTTIGTEITTDQDGSTLDVSIDLVGDTDGLLEGPVVVRTVGAEILDATVVPTRALVALVEGGFAVETTDDAGSTRLVAVEIGTFDDGLVEVTSGEISPGDLIVVPQ